MAQAAYDTDFYGWTQNQAKLLKERSFDAIDLEHLIEELNSMGAREKRELISRLRVLIMHLLKWEYQPEQRSRSWDLTIRNQRDELTIHLEDNPSLKSKVPDVLVKAYPLALRDAEKETGLPENLFPAVCPWTIEQMMDAEFWPGE